MPPVTLSCRATRWCAPTLAALAIAACSSDRVTAPPSGSSTQIAYTAVLGGVGTTYLMNADGTNQRTVLTQAADDEAPVLSPDGTRIAVTGDDFGTPQIYVFGIDGTNRTPVTSLPGGAVLASWMPDGRRLLFNSNDAHTYIVNADGSGLRLVSTDTLDEQLPVISPDGQKIVFMTERDSNDSTLLVELYVMNVDGTHPLRLTRTTGVMQGVNLFPAWSPDSRQIAFVRALDYQPPHVWMVNVDGSGLHQVFTGNDVEHSVTWSPDGRQLAFSRRPAGAPHYDIFVSNTDGSNVKDVSNTPDLDEIFPNWGRRP